MSKRLKRILLVFSALVLVFCVAGVAVGNFFFNLALSPYADKTAVYESVENEFEIDMVAYNAGLDWFSEAGFEEAYIQSYDGLALHAWVLENPATDKWVITNHGYEGSASQLSYVAAEFYEYGYSILMPNARGHGRSEGDYYGMGWHDRLDLLHWAEYLNATYGDTIEIVLYGISMGGTTVLMAAGEESLPQNVTAVVSDSAYASVYDEFAYQLKSLFGLPGVPVLNFASLVAKVRAGYWFEEGDAIAQVQNNTTPTLFIHGDSDTFVPPYMVDDLYNACPAEKLRVIFEGAGHGESSSVAGDAYWDLVFSFLGEDVAL